MPDPLVVWKYPLVAEEGGPLSSRVVVDAPPVARPLFVAEQGGRPTVWLEVDPSRPKVNTVFCTYATGESLDLPVAGRLDSSVVERTGMMVGKSLVYVGTVMRASGTVWHVYQEGWA